MDNGWKMERRLQEEERREGKGREDRRGERGQEKGKDCFLLNGGLVSPLEEKGGKFDHRTGMPTKGAATSLLRIRLQNPSIDEAHQTLRRCAGHTTQPVVVQLVLCSTDGTAACS